MLSWQQSLWSGILSVAVGVAPLSLSTAASAQTAHAAKKTTKKAPAKAAAKPPAKAPPPQTPAPTDAADPDDALDNAPPEPELPIPDDQSMPTDDPELPPDIPAGTVDKDSDEPAAPTTPPPDGSDHRLWGTVIIAGGAIFGVAGAALLISNKKQSAKKDQTLVPILMMGAGALGCLPGIAFLNQGEAEGLKYERWKEDQSEGAARRTFSPAFVWQRSF